MDRAFPSQQAGQVHLPLQCVAACRGQRRLCSSREIAHL